jgi:hypothetical protein
VSRSNRRFDTVLILSFLLTLSFGCSDKSTEPEPNQDSYDNLLDDVTFVPTQGPPGTIVTLLGLNDLPADTGFSLLIGGEPSPLVVMDDQTFGTIIPVFLDTSVSSWPFTPAGLLTVTLLYNNGPVDSVTEAIGVDSLLPAPHTFDSLITKLSSGAGALKQIALAIGATDTLLLAACDAMNELLYTGDYSLTSLMNGSSPLPGYDSASIDILSALITSSGVYDVISRWSDTLEVASGLVKEIMSAKSTSSSLTDKMLADRMQLQYMLESFGSNVVNQTNLDWQIVSSIVGAVAIAAPVLGVYEFVVSWTLGQLDFIINKIAVAMLPSDITRMELDFADHDITVGDTTQAVVYISAKNNPPNITPADIISQVLSGLKLTKWIKDRLGPNTAQTLQDQMEAMITWTLDVVTTILSRNYNSPTSLDVSIPTMTWDSVLIRDPGMIDLMIPDLGKMSYRDSSFNGLAGDQTGELRLQMRIQPGGPSTYVNSILDALGYSGGPFGDDFTTSNTDTVNIIADLYVSATLPSPINPQGAAVLNVMAGHKQADGSIDYKAGIDISLSTIGGWAENTNGITDTNGQFTTVIHPTPGFDQVTVEVVATDSTGEINTTTVTADITSYCDATDLTASVVYVLGDLEWSMSLECNPEQQTSWFMWFYLNSHMQGSDRFWTVDSTSHFVSGQGGVPQGFHGELFFEVQFWCLWDTDCNEIYAHAVDTVSVIIP